MKLNSRKILGEEVTMRTGKSLNFLRSAGSRLNEGWGINSFLFQFQREECSHKIEDLETPTQLILRLY